MLAAPDNFSVTACFYLFISPLSLLKGGGKPPPFFFRQVSEESPWCAFVLAGFQLTSFLSEQAFEHANAFIYMLFLQQKRRQEA